LAAYLAVSVLDVLAKYAMQLSDAAVTLVQMAIRKVRDHQALVQRLQSGARVVASRAPYLIGSQGIARRLI
jgi:hypothetical protein